MKIINKCKLKKEFAEKGIKISSQMINEVIKKYKINLEKEIDKIIRNARLYGRKTIRQEDLKDI